jgi:hypothetical protein
VQDGKGQNYNCEATGQEIVRALMAKLPQITNIPQEEKTQSPTSNRDFSNIEKLLTQLNHNTTNEINRLNSSVQSILVELKQQQPQHEKKAVNDEGGVSKSIKALHHEFKSENTAWVGITKFSKRALGQLSNIVHTTHNIVSPAIPLSTAHTANMAAVTPPTANVTATTGTPGFPPPKPPAAGNNNTGGRPPNNQPNNLPMNGMPSKINQAGLINGAVQAIGAGLISSVDNLRKEFGLKLENVVKGGITDPINWNKDMRATIYSLEGAGVAMTNLEKKYLDFSNATRETGMDAMRVARLTQQELKKGMVLEYQQGKLKKRDVDDTKKMVRNSLATANVLDAKAENVAELFGDWNRQLGFSNQQMVTLGRSMEMVAKTTGVTGDNLIEIAKSANKTVMELRNFAGINERAIGQIIQMQASLKKFGGEDLGNKINEAIAGGMEGFSKAQTGLRSLVAMSAKNAGLWVDILNGEILNNPEKNKTLYKQIEKDLGGILRQQSGGLLTGNLATLTEEMEKLRNDGDPRHAQIAAQIQNNKLIKDLGGIGQIEALGKSIKESTKTFSERIGELENKKKGAKEGSYESKLYEKQIKDLTATRRNQEVSQFGVEMDKTGDANKALARVNQGRERNEQLQLPDIQKMGKQRVEDVISKGKEAGFDVVGMMKAKGISQQEMEQGLVGKSAGEFASKLQEIENQIISQEKANQDPMLKAQFALLKASEDLKSAIQRLTGAFLTFETLLAAVLLGFAAKFAALFWGTGGQLLRGLGQLGKVPGIPSVGGGGAAGIPWMPNPTPTNPIPTGGGFPPMGGKTPNTINPPPITPNKGAGFPTMGGNVPYGGAAPTNPLPNAIPPTVSGGTGSLFSGSKNKYLRGIGSVLGWMNRNPTKTGAIAGSVAGSVYGYSNAEEGHGLRDTLYGGVQGTALGAGAGGLYGMVKGTGQGTQGMPGMENMPGYNQGCMPVCIVADHTNGRGGVTGTLNNVVNTVASVAGTASTAQEAGSLMKWIGSKIPGGSKIGGMLSKIPGVGGGVAASGGLLRLAGKALAPLEVLRGTVSGYSDAGSQGRGKFSGTALGALTGDVDTGSSLSSMVGIQKGGVADELMGIGGAGIRGAAIGAFAGLPGAIIGGALGSGAEIFKILTKEGSPIRQKLGSIASGIWGGVTSSVSWLGEKITNNAGVITGILTGGFGPIGALIPSVFQSGADMITSGINTAAKFISSIDFSSLSQSLVDVFSNVGSMIANAWESTKNFLSNAASKTWEGAKNLGSNVWEGTKSLGSDALEGAKSLGSDVWEGAKDVTASIIDGLSSFFGNLSLFAEGTPKITKTGMAVVHEGEAIIPKTITESLMAAGSGPFKVNDTGSVANLGAFEMKQPLEAGISGTESIIDQTVNSGLGVLGTFGTALDNFGKSVKDFGETSGLSKVIQTIKEYLMPKATPDTSPLNMGLFSKENVKEASTDNLIRTVDVLKEGISNQDIVKNALKEYTSTNSKDSSSLNMGLFSKDNIKDATSEQNNTFENHLGINSINNEVIRSIIQDKNKTSNTMTLENKGLFDTNNVKETAQIFEEAISRFAGVDLNNIYESRKSSLNGNKGTGNTTKSLYLTDDGDYESSTSNTPSYNTATTIGSVLERAYNNRSVPKGSASTALFTAEDAEKFVANNVESGKPTGPTAMLPSMDSIFEYLNNVQAGKLDDIINVLTQIRDRTGTPLLLSKNSNGDQPMPSTEKSGIKNWSKDKITGTWPLQHGSFQEMHNATGDINE